METLFNVSFYGSGTPAQLALLSHSDLTSDIRKFLTKYRVETVIVLPLGEHSATVTSHISEAIGPPVYSGTVALWYHVKRRLTSSSF